MVVKRSADDVLGTCILWPNSQNMSLLKFTKGRTHRKIYHFNQGSLQFLKTFIKQFLFQTMNAI